MKKYQKLIRPMLCYPSAHYSPTTKPIETIQSWYPEDKKEELKKKYQKLNSTFFNVVFDTKYVEIIQE